MSSPLSQMISPALMHQTNRSAFRPLLSDVSFLISAVILLVFMQAILRALLWVRNLPLSENIPVSDIAWSFVIGARFDLLVVAYIMLPLVFILLLPNGLGGRKLVRAWLMVTGSLLLFLGVSELEFYHEFNTRLNSLAIQYWKEDPATVGSMIWNAFPVVRYLLLWVTLAAFYVWVLSRLNHLIQKFGQPYPRVWLRLPIFLVCAFLLAWAARGTLRSGPPLRWGDAFHSQHLFANHLALNGSWSFLKAATGNQKQEAGKSWMKAMPADEALQRTRQLLVTDTDISRFEEQYPILRTHHPVKQLEKKPKNLVFIIMESFSAQFTETLGKEPDITPHFDRLAKEGLLFDRFFSNGTHSHQGMFSTGACFPNIPGYEYLMQEPEGQHPFSGLPALLKNKGFQDVYVYNGAFNWDNQEGFFRNQGMTRFIGRDEMENPQFVDPTWGVSDQDMFNQALRELNRMDSETPFYAILQTLSNHLPYTLPEPLPVSPVTHFGESNEHLTTMRYADWALGRFFDEAKKQDWYQDTLFMLVGDHGFRPKQQLGEINLLRYYVPMLLLAPGIQDTYGKRNHKVATQVDIIPTALSLLFGKPFTHQCWGRDLLSLPENDPGFGIIKPSGSDHTVAYLRGNKILIAPPQGEATLGIYKLYPTPSYTVTPGLPQREAMLKDMKAYVGSAMRELQRNRTGIPEP